MMRDAGIAQKLVGDWQTRCFGEAQFRDLHERGLRILEEAVELAQASGVSKETVSRVVDVVYNRPAGQPAQEVGGVGVTLLGYANALDTPLEDMVWTEIRRILAKSPEQFRQRDAEKREQGISDKAGITIEQSHDRNNIVPCIIVKEIPDPSTSITEKGAGNLPRPLRDRCMHKKCGFVVELSPTDASIMARDPTYYLNIFCSVCKMHYPINMFVWAGTDIEVGT